MRVYRTTSARIHFGYSYEPDPVPDPIPPSENEWTLMSVSIASHSHPGGTHAPSTEVLIIWTWAS